MLDVVNSALVTEALAGLSASQKSLSPKWLYDQRGSQLFEQITALPEYYLTRTEAAILATHADRLAALVPAGGALVELGSGASVKTRTLLDAGHHFGAYVPIDISAAFLHETASGLRLRYPDLTISPVVGDFTSAVALPEALARVPKVGFFPGSTLGNLEPEMGRALMANARAWDGVEGFILGVDLVKDPATLVAAYDDAQGVTAEFILNLLNRLNVEADANFDLSAFRYEASWDADLARIDMRVISEVAQEVRLAGHVIPFAEDEAIHISASRKYTRGSLEELVQAAGWQVDDMVTDAADAFAVAVLRPVGD